MNNKQENNRVLKSLFKSNYFAKKTFTYYIPSPPIRKTGYQEREFDAIIEHISNLGYDILNFTVQAHQNKDGGGIWVICLLAAPTKEIYQKKIELNLDIIYKNNSHSDPSLALDPNISHDI